MSYLTGIRESLESKDRSTGVQKRATAVSDIYDVYRKQQNNYRLSWLITTAFARGIQYAVLDENDLLITPLLPKGRKRCKENQIGAWKGDMLSRVTKVKPEFEVTPTQMDMMGIDKAQVGTAFLQHFIKINEWQKKRYTITSYCLDFGNCFAYLRDERDKLRLVPTIVKDISGEVEVEEGEAKIVGSSVVEVKGEILLPHNVFLDLNPSPLSEKYEAILAFWRDLTYFDLVYNKKVTPDKSGKGLSNYNLDLLSRKRDLPESLEGATELVYLRPPNDKDKKGRVIITTLNGKEILDEFEWPYEHLKELPLVHYTWDEPPPGEFYARSPMEDQVPLQKDLNEVLSIVQENIYNVGHIKWGIPIGSQVTDINDLSGEVVMHTPGMRPEQIPIAHLPNYEVSQPDKIKRSLEDVQHHHSVSRGEAGGGPRSEVGLTKLEEEDNSSLGTTDDFFSAANMRLATIALKIAAEKMDIPQFIRYVGKGRRRAIKNFVGSMLDPESDVNVRMVDGYLRNKGTAQSTIIQLAQNGLITDKFGNPDPGRVQKMLQFAIPEAIYDKEDTQRDLAYDENEEILEGRNVFAQEWEYQLIHIEVIEELLNSKEFKLKTRDNEELLKRAIQHREDHQMIFAKAMGVKVPQGEEEEVPKGEASFR